MLPRPPLNEDPNTASLGGLGTRPNRSQDGSLVLLFGRHARPLSRGQFFVTRRDRFWVSLDSAGRRAPVKGGGEGGRLRAVFRLYYQPRWGVPCVCFGREKQGLVVETLLISSDSFSKLVTPTLWAPSHAALDMPPFSIFLGPPLPRAMLERRHDIRHSGDRLGYGVSVSLGRREASGKARLRMERPAARSFRSALPDLPAVMVWQR
jgi:hypothetical protein